MRRLFLLVSAVVLVDTMFFAAVAPLLPYYSDELDLSKTGAGVLTAAYPAGTFAGALPGGWLAARWGVKPTLLVGLGLLGVTSLAFGFANHIVVMLDAARFVQGIGGAFMWAAGMTWLVSAAPADRRGELIGSALAAAIVGVLLGPVLGGAATVVGPEVVFTGVSRGGRGACCLGLAHPRRACPSRARAWPRWRGRFAGATCSSGFWLFTVPALFERRDRGARPAAARRTRRDRRRDRRDLPGHGRGGGRAEPGRRPRLGSPRAARPDPRSGSLGAMVMAALLPLPDNVVAARAGRPA